MFEYQSRIEECEECGTTFNTVLEGDGFIRNSHCAECWAKIELMADIFCPVPGEELEDAVFAGGGFIWRY